MKRRFLGFQIDLYEILQKNRVPIFGDLLKNHLKQSELLTDPNVEVDANLLDHIHTDFEG